MSNFDDMSSLGSCLSDMSICIDGKEFDLENYIDETFKNLQKHINMLHQTIRLLAFSDDRGETVEEYGKKYCDLLEHVTEAAELFTDLPSSMADLLPEMSKDEKKMFKDIVKMKKAELKAKKAERKAKRLEHVKEFNGNDEKKC